MRCYICLGGGAPKTPCGCNYAHKDCLEKWRGGNLFCEMCKRPYFNPLPLLFAIYIYLLWFK